MLEKLDEIKWDELFVSTGRPATGVDDDIRGLISKSPVERKRAFRNLQAALCSDYFLETATLAAIPFLIELLQSEETQDKQYILYLFRDCLQYSEMPDRKIAPNWLHWFELFVKIGQTISEGLETYIQLLEHSEWNTRLAACSLLATRPFPREQQQRIENAYQEFKQSETHPEIRQYFEKWDKTRTHYLVSEPPPDQSATDE